MHDNVDDLIESALNSKLLSINSNFQRLDKKKQEVKNVVEQSAERGTHKRECDVLVCEDSSTFDVCDNHSDILSDSNNDDDISSDDDVFEDIDVFKNDISDDSLNDPLLEEADLFLAFDNSIPPCIENFGYDSEGDIRFLEELLIDDSIPFLVNESFNFEDDPLFPRPPPEPPDAEFDFEPDSGEVTSAVMKNIDELNEDECFDPGGEIDVSPLFLSAESEDNIFDPEIPSGEIKDNDSQREEIDIVTNTDELLPPGFENDDSKGEIDVVEELHVDNSISNSKNELSDNEASDFDNPSFPRPPPEPPDAEFECLDPRDKIDVSTND
nr:hypothetical protein [Tanacetum cinerariifolium]